jgi:hypothetical protein
MSVFAAPRPAATHRAHRPQQGQVIVLFAIALAVLMGIAAVVIDLGLLRADKARLQNALDAGALAAVHGGLITPANGQEAHDNAVKYVQTNFAGVTPTIKYFCLVSRNTATGLPNVSDVGASGACDVGLNPAAPALDTRWKCGPGSCWIPCNPAAGNTCNTVQLAGSATRSFAFGPAVKVDSGNTGGVTSAACVGACGQKVATTAPFDLVIILDRTGSMSSRRTGTAPPCTWGGITLTEGSDGPDLLNLRCATLALLSSLDPNTQRVSVGLLPASSVAAAGTTCPTTVPPSGIGSTWIPVPLSYGYSANGLLNATSQVVEAVTCFNANGSTNLASPLWFAVDYLSQVTNRPGVPKAIILETDGAPNQTDSEHFPGLDPCAAAVAAADLVRAYDDIQLYTVGFGAEQDNGASCSDPNYRQTGGAVRLLSDMSTKPAIGSTSCTAAENTDGDHFFCEPKGNELTPVFESIYQDLINTSGKLVQLYPQPYVTSVSPSSGSRAGGYSVTVTGGYFTDASSVTFGSGSASFQVLDDSHILVRSAPARGSIGTVDVLVSTPGGTSAVVSGDKFRYTSP